MLSAFCIKPLTYRPVLIPVVGIAMGYPAASASPSDRLPVDAVLHLEKFTDYTPSRSTLTTRKESLPESAGVHNMNSKKTLAQVYADIRYPRDLNESVGQAMLKHMSQV